MIGYANRLMYESPRMLLPSYGFGKLARDAKHRRKIQLDRKHIDEYDASASSPEIVMKRGPFHYRSQPRPEQFSQQP
jgi:hypothetical protein